MRQLYVCRKYTVLHQLVIYIYMPPCHPYYIVTLKYANVSNFIWFYRFGTGYTLQARVQTGIGVELSPLSRSPPPYSPTAGTPPSYPPHAAPQGEDVSLINNVKAFIGQSFVGAVLTEEHQVCIATKTLIDLVMFKRKDYRIDEFWGINLYKTSINLAQNSGSCHPYHGRMAHTFPRAQWPTRSPVPDWPGPQCSINWRLTRRDLASLTTLSARLPLTRSAAIAVTWMTICLFNDMMQVFINFAKEQLVDGSTL